MISRKDEKEPELCVICAWRKDCQKKFTLAYGQKCPEFTRDLTLKAKPSEEKPSEEK
jgi:hypothetical protein